MPEVVLRHPDLQNQPMILDIGASGVVSADWAEAGWEIDASTDPAKARLEAPQVKQLDAVAPHFADAAAESVQSQPVPTPEPVQPSEQGDVTSLDISKE